LIRGVKLPFFIGTKKLAWHLLLIYVDFEGYWMGIICRLASTVEVKSKYFLVKKNQFFYNNRKCRIFNALEGDIRSDYITGSHIAESAIYGEGN
jgi:hypothetical protein